MNTNLLNQYKRMFEQPVTKSPKVNQSAVYRNGIKVNSPKSQLDQGSQQVKSKLPPKSGTSRPSVSQRMNKFEQQATIVEEESPNKKPLSQEREVIFRKGARTISQQRPSGYQLDPKVPQFVKRRDSSNHSSSKSKQGTNKKRASGSRKS